MPDIHVKIDNAWFERWKKCSKFRGQRSGLLQSLIKKLIVVLEQQKEVPLDITVTVRPNGPKETNGPTS